MAAVHVSKITIEELKTNGIVKRSKQEKNGLWSLKQKHVQKAKIWSKRKQVNRPSSRNSAENEEIGFWLLSVITLIGLKGNKSKNKEVMDVNA